MEWNTISNAHLGTGVVVVSTVASLLPTALSVLGSSPTWDNTV